MGKRTSILRVRKPSGVSPLAAAKCCETFSLSLLLFLFLLRVTRGPVRMDVVCFLLVFLPVNEIFFIFRCLNKPPFVQPIAPGCSFLESPKFSLDLPLQERGFPRDAFTRL